MALGLAKGRERIQDTERYVEAMGFANKIVEEFQAGLWSEFGFSEPLESTLCREIQAKIYGRPFNLLDPVEKRPSSTREGTATRDATRCAGSQLR